MRSSRLPFKPAELDKFLVQIRESSPFDEINSSPFFHLVKPTEENLRKYKLRLPRSKSLLVIEYLNVFPLIFIRSLFSLIFSVFSLLEFRPKKAKLLEKSEYLFLSHFTHAQNPKKEDIFYGENLDFKESYTFYLNHTQSLSPQIVKRFNDENKLKITVNTKSLSPLSMIKLHANQFRLSLWLFAKSLGDNSLGIEKRRILAKAASFQHGRSTMANLVLKSRLSETILRVEPKILILTIEGHAHEKMVVDVSRSLIKDIKIIGYQHAPIVPGQLNLFRIVSDFHSNDYFLTTGEVTKSLALVHVPSCRVDILGSPKFRTFEYQKKDFAHLRVLLTPEAPKEPLIELAYLARELSLTMPSALFVIRPHPDTSKKGMAHLSKLLNGLSNVQISELPLSADLKSSHVTLFRSSSAALEGMAFGSLPIHFELGGNGSLNPLFDTKFGVNAFYEYEGLCKYLNKLNLLNFQLEEKQREFFEEFLLYFSKYRDFKALVR